MVLGSRVAEVGHGSLRLEDGRQVEADEILWTTQAAAPRWLRDTGLTLDPGGFISVDSRLRAVGHTDVFAAGDVTSFMPRALPKSGVYAVRAGPVLADNIRRLLTGSELRPFRPQADAMYIVSTGDAYAVGTKWGIAFAGAWVWRLKDWIDRRFMDRFNALPEMDTAVHGPASKLADKAALQEISAIAMRCGGCGAKVGSTVLTRALGNACAPSSATTCWSGSTRRTMQRSWILAGDA